MVSTYCVNEDQFAGQPTSTFSPSGVTRGHQFKLYKTRAEGARNTFFTNGVVNVWNAISPDTVDFTSLCTFKHTIKFADFSPFLKASMS